MTVSELYDWALENGVEDLEVGIQFQDDGGTFPGDTFSAGYEVEPSVEKQGKEEYILLA